MKKLTLLFSILLLSLWTLAQQANKVALIFALSEYQAETKWPAINAHNDVPLIKEALQKRGFDNKNIHAYVNGLTKQAMIDAIRKHIINGVKPGDVVYFQYSGHGQQIATNTPELEVDGLDEALVPVDAPATNKIMVNGKEQPYQFDKHLRDKELRDLLLEVREKLGPNGNLFVVIDACHSGGATRGFGIHRGSASPNVPEGWKPPTTRILAANTGFTLGERDGKVAPMAVFSASGPHQLNYEYEHKEENKYYGSLSYALANAILESGHNLSYKSLFDQVKNKMLTLAPRQNPLAEGEMDQEIFGGKLLPKSNYFTGKRINDSEWEIDAGQLMSVYEGSIVGFFAPDTREENLEQAKPLAEGKVIRSSTTTARVQITSGKLEKNQVPWVYITQKTFEGISIKYKLISDNKTVIEAWRKSIAPYTFLQESNDNDVNLIVEYGTSFSGKDKLVISTVDDLKIYESTINPKDAEPLVLAGVQNGLQKMKSYAQAGFVRQLTATPARLPASFEILAYRFKELALDANYDEIMNHLNQVLDAEESLEDALVPIPQEWIKTASGDYHIPEGVLFEIKMQNGSNRDIYYSILHISPDNEITAIFPNEDNPSASEYRIGANRSEISGMLLMSPPTGTDVYKLFFSTRELNLLKTVTTRGIGSPAPENSVEAFMQESYKTEALTRSAVRIQQQGGDLLNIQNLIIKIVPAGHFLGVQ